MTSPTVVIGAGPAGLAAAWRLGRAAKPVVLIERDPQVGGLSRPLELSGTRFDVGAHVFKPRTQAVADLWDELCDGRYEPESEERSAIYSGGSLHASKRDYFFSQSLRTRARIALQLLGRLLRPRPVLSGEDWLRNVRGDALYDALYRPREEKLWGEPLSRIDPSWYTSQSRPFTARLRAGRQPGSPGIDEAIQVPVRYPVGGAGALYARLGDSLGGTTRTLLDCEARAVVQHGGRVVAVHYHNLQTGETDEVECGAVISTASLPQLVRALDPAPERAVLQAASSLQHRDLVLVNLVIDEEGAFPYEFVHPYTFDVKAFRITGFANMSPAMRGPEGRTPVTVEYNCFHGDQTWEASDDALVELALAELGTIGLVDAQRVRDAKVERFREAYPIHSLGYRAIADRLIERLDEVGGLQTIGRNGMFTYNQMSHSVECGILAAENVLGASHQLVVPGVFDLPF
ncbi:MAG: FAD-dependent oxidoreductase [Myxococcota bacterium]|nr:FAD-dependent oxidoreductase [Myxococcota bacterium]